MVWDWATVTEPKASKQHHCDASEWIANTIGFEEGAFAKEDIPAMRQAKAEGYKILKGTRYINVKGKFDGEFSVFRARKDLDAICKKYDLYEE